MECKYALKIENFPFRLCKLQKEIPVGCNSNFVNSCIILEEYNMSKSAQHPTFEGENVR